MNLLCKLLLWAVMITFLAAGAKAQEETQGSGVFCSEPAQLERLIDHATKLGDVRQAVVAVNEEVGGAQSCGIATVIGVVGKAHKTVESPQGLLDIVPVAVRQYFTPLGAQTFEHPQTWYVLVASDKRGA